MMRTLGRARKNYLAAFALAFVAASFASISFAQSPATPSNAAASPAATLEPAQPSAPATGAPAAGQGPTGSFAGLSKNSDKPIDIESDTLLVHDSQKTATFKGNVKAVQGTTILHSKELEVHYAGGGGEALTGAPGAKPSAVASTDAEAVTPQATPATETSQPAKPAAAGDKSGVALGDNGTKITRIYARGDVVINSDQDQTTTGDLADYDVPGQTVVVSGNVVLTQGKNVLKGDRLVINLTTGESRFDPGSGNSGKPARIKAIFQKQEAASGDDASKKDKPAEKTGDAAPGDETSGAAKGAASEPQAAEAAQETERPAKEAPAKPSAAQDDASPWQLVPGNMQ
jgi:lipopolysaccharide export system protein LptA